MSAGILAPRLLGDASIGWHIRNGELMLRTHAITRADPFSSSMSGQPWYAWEWLYDLKIAVVHGWWGLNGVVFVSAVIIALTFAIVFRLTLNRGGSVSVCVPLLILTFGASAIHLFARPHILSWLFAVMWFQILDSADSAPSSISYRRLFWLPALMLLWVNLHGGFVTGFVLLGLYMLAAVVNFFHTKELTERQNISRWLRRLLTINGLSLLASLVNPYGYKLHAHVYEYLSNRWLMDHIDEFLSPNFHKLAQQCFVGMLLITLLTFVISRKKPRLSVILVVLFAAYSGLYASRNLPLSSMLLMMNVGPLLSKSIADAPYSQFASWLSRYWSRWNSFDLRMHRTETNFRAHVWPVAVIILGVVTCIHGGRLGQLQLMNAHFDAKRFPVQSAEFIAGKNISGPIFSLDSWGGYLIYRLPQNKVFVDDRHDFYGQKFLKDYLQVVRATPDWKTRLDQDDVNCALVPSNSSIATLLKESLQWKLVNEDATAVLFQKQSEK